MLMYGVLMFVLARQYFNRSDAIFAVALYVVNPYIIVIVYWRSVFVELLAASFLSFLLL